VSVKFMFKYVQSFWAIGMCIIPCCKRNSAVLLFLLVHRVGRQTESITADTHLPVRATSGCNLLLSLVRRSVSNQRVCSQLSPISSSPRQRDARSRRDAIGWDGVSDAQIFTFPSKTFHQKIYD